MLRVIRLGLVYDRLCIRLMLVSMKGIHHLLDLCVNSHMPQMAMGSSVGLTRRGLYSSTEPMIVQRG